MGASRFISGDGRFINGLVTILAVLILIGGIIAIIVIITTKSLAPVPSAPVPSAPVPSAPVPSAPVVLNKCRGACSNSLTSPNGSSVATLSASGMLVITTKGSQQWTNGANGSNGPYKLQMQADGNLVIYDTSNAAKWASGIGGGTNGPYTLIMQDDGNLVIHDKNNTASWASQSAPQWAAPK